MSMDDSLRVLLSEEVRKVVREELAHYTAGLQPSANAERELLSPKQAGDLAGVNPATIRSWIAAGLTSYGKGRVLRVRRTDLLSYLSSRAPGVERQTPEEQAISILTRLPARSARK